MSTAKTLYDKIWDAHIVNSDPDGTCLLYIDRHLVHEVTSPQAFEGLRLSGRKVRAPEKTIAVPDHNVPTTENEMMVSIMRKVGSRWKHWTKTQRTLVSIITLFQIYVRGSYI